MGYFFRTTKELVTRAVTRKVKKNAIFRRIPPGLIPLPAPVEPAERMIRSRFGDWERSVNYQRKCSRS